MKTTRKLFSVLLAVLLLALTMVIAVVPAQAYDTIQFGNYPQSRVTDNSLINALNDAPKTWQSYGYYIGNDSYDGLMQPGDWMQYADFSSGGVKYRAVKFTKYRPHVSSYSSNVFNSYQDDNSYLLNTTYYFKYEPLTWRVLDVSTGLILCDSIIDAQAYQNVVRKSGSDYYVGTTSTYVNNYKESSIRTWLNNDFYNTAFNSTQKAKIKSTAINNDAYSSTYSQYNSPSTTDKIYLLSCDEAESSSYGLSLASARKAKGTNYAKCQGLWVKSSNGFSVWRLRSAGSASDYACGVSPVGALDYEYNVYITSNGIRPACNLTNLESDISLPVAYTITVSASPAQGGTVAGGGTYNEGTTATVKATANSGYHFIGWYEGGTKIKDTESYTFTVTKDVSLTAKFLEADKMIRLKKPTDQLNDGDWYYDVDATYAAIAQSMEVSVDDLIAFTDGLFYKARAEYDPDSGVLILWDPVSDDPSDSRVICPGDVGYEEYTAGVKQYKAPTQPDNPGQSANLCKWCGKTHEGFFQKIIGFFHNIMAKIFGAKY